ASFSSTGTSIPLQYQFANKIPSTFDPSGLSQYISEYGDSNLSSTFTSLLNPVGFTPLPKAAASMPACFNICGACPMLPKESGKYPILQGSILYFLQSLCPYCKFLIFDSLLVKNSS